MNHAPARCSRKIPSTTALPNRRDTSQLISMGLVCTDVPPKSVTVTRSATPPAHPGSDRGYSWLFQSHVTQADEGCDFDFLQSTQRKA